MSEVTPSLPDAHIIRKYPNDYVASDTGSEAEAQFEVYQKEITNEDLVSEAA